MNFSENDIFTQKSGKAEIKTNRFKLSRLSKAPISTSIAEEKEWKPKALYSKFKTDNEYKFAHKQPRQPISTQDRIVLNQGIDKDETSSNC